MKVPEKFLSRNPPAVSLLGLPEAELVQARHLVSLLARLKEYSDHFAHAVALVDYCEQKGKNESANSLYRSWIWVACRDGGMSIWHFGETLLAIRSGFRECPEFRNQISFDELRSAWKGFCKEFPFAEAMRHSIAHSSTLTKTVEDIQKNTPTGLYYDKPGKVVMMGRVHNIFIRRKYINTINGQYVEYHLTPQTVLSLKGFAERVYAAFSPPDPLGTSAAP